MRATMCHESERSRIPLYDRFTALDAVGSATRCSRACLARASPGWRTSRASCATTTACSASRPTAAFEDLPDPEIVLVPGGTGTNDVLDDERLVGWIRRAHETSRVDHVRLHRLAATAAPPACSTASRPPPTGSTCPTSSATARGPRAARREQGKVVTAAGVSSGIDMGLVLAAKIAGRDVAEAIQLGIEYDPQPPFDAGSVDRAARTRRRSSTGPEPRRRLPRPRCRRRHDASATSRAATRAGDAFMLEQKRPRGARRT